MDKEFWAVVAMCQRTFDDPHEADRMRAAAGYRGGRWFEKDQEAEAK